MDDSGEGVEANQIHGGESVNTATTRSRHSSVHGPYRDNVSPKNGFPLCNRVATAYGSAESYSRAMLSLGHGYPILDVVGDWDRSSLHLNRGPSLGDIGLLNPSGDFLFLFNIFAPPNDPIHIDETPPGFVPMKYPDPTEVVRVPNYFSPGSVFASKGITIDRVSDLPFEFNVSTSAREGGILVLPDGASREDFIPTNSLLEYIEENAVAWYAHIPHIPRGSLDFIPNGSLYLITGCDKTHSATCVVVPSRMRWSGIEMNIQYKQDNPRQWSDSNFIRICTNRPDRYPGAHYAVFIRGIRISLSHLAWARNPSYGKPPLRGYFNLLSTPITGRLSRIVRRLELRYGPWSTEYSGHLEIPFHISDIIAQIILNDARDSEVVVVEDSVWMNHVDTVSGDGTVSQMFKLLLRAFLAHEIDSSSKKLVRLVRQGETSPGVLKGIYNRWRMERKIKKVIYERRPVEDE